MACVFITNLFNMSNDTDLVKKFYQFEDQIIVNFVLIKLKNQVKNLIILTNIS
jgi:hypothetical protein